MIKYLVFLIPLTSLLFNLYQRILNGEKSAVKHIEVIEKFGLKGILFSSPLRCSSFIACLISPVYIRLGWFWAIMAVIYLLAIVFIPSTQIKMPEFGSKQFLDLVERRRKQSYIGIFWLVLWLFSWSKIINT